MTNYGEAEVYFIAAMMILICVVCVASVFIFFRQMKREKNAPKITRKTLNEQRKSEQEYVEK